MSRSVKVVVSGVYPRVCGGTQAVRAICWHNDGLSPRMRGNPLPLCSDPFCSGSIPAYAGEPRPHRLGRMLRAVYPRVCGGTLRQLDESVDGHGLSPRMRGNPADLGLAFPLCGSIPAYAGEPNAGLHAVLSVWVYPRVCGGTARKRKGGHLKKGLSPRMRGEPCCWARTRPHIWVYPRVCGGTPGERGNL